MEEIVKKMEEMSSKLAMLRLERFFFINPIISIRSPIILRKIIMIKGFPLLLRIIAFLMKRRKKKQTRI